VYLTTVIPSVLYGDPFVNLNLDWYRFISSGEGDGGGGGGVGLDLQTDNYRVCHCAEQGVYKQGVQGVCPLKVLIINNSLFITGSKIQNTIMIDDIQYCIIHICMKNEHTRGEGKIK
jgi:hypothetical protein